jgi:hypothetical protein
MTRKGREEKEEMITITSLESKAKKKKIGKMIGKKQKRYN